MVREADAVVFVISPNSVASDVSGWILDEAIRYGKRIVPVVAKRVPDYQIPPQVSRLNFIWFTQESDRISAIDTLSQVLNTDSAWARQHTHIGQLAHLWDAHVGDSDYLLRGKALDEAVGWVAARPPQGMQLDASRNLAPSGVF
jgi:hypothetical protein